MVQGQSNQKECSTTAPVSHPGLGARRPAAFIIIERDGVGIGRGYFRQFGPEFHLALTYQALRSALNDYEAINLI